MRVALEEILTRRKSFGIRPITARVVAHPRQDPGCRLEAAEFLKGLEKQYRYALVLFDHEGCGTESMARVDLEGAIEEELARSGWEGRNAVIVIEPELEAWLWSDSPHVERTLGWGRESGKLRDWLRQEGFWPADHPKPPRPKESAEAALRQTRHPFSSAIHGELAKKVGLSRCTDESFAKLRRVLKDWFPAKPS